MIPPEVARALDGLVRAGSVTPAAEIETLVAAGDSAVEPLLGLLDGTEPDEDDWTPLWAAVALGELKSPRAVPTLLRLLALPEGDVLAEAAVEALAKVGPPALPPLLDFARNAREWEARAYAYAAIGLIPDETSLTFLVRALDGDPLLWGPIAMALADLGDGRAVEPLEAVARRCDEREAEPIREALEILNGARPAPPRLAERPWRERYAGIAAA